MKTIKPILAAAAVLAVGAGLFAGWKFKVAADTRAAVAALNEQHKVQSARLVAAEARLQAETKRVQTVEADNALLGEALRRAQAEKAAKAAQANAPVTREAVEARFRVAQQRARDGGDPAETLRELLWCWDEGFPRVGGSNATRLWAVISAIGTLGATYPEALAVLQERREALKQRVLAGPGGVDAAGEYASVLRALNEPQAILQVYDQIPAGDNRRVHLGIYAFEPMLEARRYADVVVSRSYAAMSAQFESDAQERPLPVTLREPEKFRAMQRQRFVAETGKNIEVLAGVGDLPHARDLADRLLAYDRSADTRAVVEKHLERAGQPGLLTDQKK